MRIKIKAFKSCLDAEYIFEAGKMTLLDGGSGAGKTTILQAIFWAMYGNMRGIYNNTGITKNLSVELTLPGIKIFRKKNSDLLVLTIYENNGDQIIEMNPEGSSPIFEKTYENAIAQAEIDKRYGNRDLFHAATYIEQKDRCTLLSGTGAERLELLNSLSFTGESPKEYISKINTALKSATLDFEKAQAVYSSDSAKFLEEVEKIPPVSYTRKDLQEMTDNISKKETQLQELYEKLLSQQRLEGSIAYLENLSKSVKIPSLKPNPKPKLDVFNLPEPVLANEYEIPIDIPTLEILKADKDDNIILSYEDYIQEKNRLTTLSKQLTKEKLLLEKLKKELREQKEREEKRRVWEQEKQGLEEELRDKPISKVLVTEEQIWEARNLEKLVEEEKNKAEKIGIEYDLDVISSKLVPLEKTLESYLKCEANLETYSKLLDVEKKLTETYEPDVEAIEKISSKLFEELSDMKRGLDVLSCPSCDSHLRYTKSSLELADHSPISKTTLGKKQKEYDDSVKKLNEEKKLSSQYKNLLVERSCYDLDDNERFEMESYDSTRLPRLQRLIANLKDIKFYEPLSVFELEEQFSIQEKRKSLEKLEQQYETLIGNNITEEQVSEQEEKVNELDNSTETSEELESLYQQEQERLKKNQALLKAVSQKMDKQQAVIKELQKKEANRLSKIKLFKVEKKKWIEKKDRFEKQNQVAMEEYLVIERENEAIQKEIETVYNCIFSYRGQIEHLQLQIDLELKTCHANLRAEIGFDKTKMEEMKLYIDMVLVLTKKQEELDKQSLFCIEKENDVAALQELKLTALQVEAEHLQDTVTNINYMLQTTLPIFFHDPITMVLHLYKKTKDSKKDNYLKPGLNFEISYKGSRFDDVKSLSGGEGDRISLALLLALNFCSSSPLLMMDECVSSLEQELKESVLEAIKLVPDKTIIVIDHDETMTGFYDTVISI